MTALFRNRSFQERLIFTLRLTTFPLQVQALNLLHTLRDLWDMQVHSLAMG